MTDEWRNETNKDSKGGTEQMMERIYTSSVLKPYLKDFQIIPSRVRDLSDDKYRIYYLHDLSGDPESKHLANEGWRKFNKLVFVSNWQMWEYVKAYDIPMSKCAVIRNAIEPFEERGPVVDVTPNDPVKLIYHTTPHRGLEILVPVFKRLCEELPDINMHLDVYSSFKMYGWGERDEQYKQLFREIEEHPQMTYHGFQSNEVIREALTEAHIFPYPSIWMETSCLALIEAMAAGLVCVHPNYAALPETSAGLTYQYQMHEDLNEHASIHYQVLEDLILDLANEDLLETHTFGVNLSSLYANHVYNWETVQYEWETLFEHLLDNEVPVGKEEREERGSDNLVLEVGKR